MQKDNQFKICDYFSRQGNVARMLAETDAYNKILLEDQEYAKIEENLNWLLGHDGLSAAQKIETGAKIYEIDRFYNPYSKIEPMF